METLWSVSGVGKGGVGRNASNTCCALVRRKGGEGGLCRNLLGPLEAVCVCVCLSVGMV